MTLLLLLGGSGGGGSNDLFDSLQHVWIMEETSEDTLTDMVGSADLSKSGGGTIPHVSGPHVNAREYGGAKHTGAVSVPLPFTLSCWFKSPSGAEEPVIRLTNSESDTIEIQLGNIAVLDIDNGTSSDTLSGGAASTGFFHNLVIRLTASQMTINVDGTKATKSHSIGSLGTLTTLEIGPSSFVRTGDEVYIWDRELSDTEAGRLASEYWPFQKPTPDAERLTFKPLTPETITSQTARAFRFVPQKPVETTSTVRPFRMVPATPAASASPSASRPFRFVPLTPSTEPAQQAGSITVDVVPLQPVIPTAGARPINFVPSGVAGHLASVRPVRFVPVTPSTNFETPPSRSFRLVPQTPVETVSTVRPFRFVPLRPAGMAVNAVPIRFKPLARQQIVTSSKIDDIAIVSGQIASVSITIGRIESVTTSSGQIAGVKISSGGE